MSEVRLEVSENIACITIDRPAALNALNRAVMQGLDRILQDVSVRKEVRGVLITGAGEKAFVAGADIAELAQMNEDGAKAFAQDGHRIFEKIEKLPVPVVAAVNGFALGGGLELALACDFIYASENAKLGLPEVTLGLIPGFGGTARLARVIGLNRARELVMSGLPVTAAQALQIGLVNEVVPLVSLLPRVREVLGQMTARGPMAVAAAKRSMLEQEGLRLAQQLSIEAQAFSRLFASEDYKEGTQAFLQKRKPQFVGR